MNLSDPVTIIPFIGEKYCKLLKKLDIETVEDLLRHYPTHYDDLSTIKKISELVAGEKATICTEILEIKNIRTKHGKLLTKAVVSDESGTLSIVWFNQPYLTNAIRVGNFYNFSGELKSFSGRPAFLGPEYERTVGQLDNRKGETAKLIHTGRLVPTYPETAGVSSKWLRSRINSVIRNPLSVIRNLEILPEKIREEFNLVEIEQALQSIHFPKSKEGVEKARKRLAFEEMFLLQLKTLKKRQEWEEQQTAIGFQLSDTSKQQTADFTRSLPFQLTEAQKCCIDEILSDLNKNQPMNRLLQGDVGSGKTVVAAIAACATALNGYQTAYMAPTEILAQQVYKIFKDYLEPFGISISLQTGSAKGNKGQVTSNQETRDQDTKYGNIVVGTHALLHRPELFDKLALVIIDEQHRFGVKQRGKLLNRDTRHRNTEIPHLLTMTATPIPRSLALTTYGHLDISIINEMPPGVKPTKTWLVPEEKREAGYEWIKKQLSAASNQAFIICPLIEESEHETLEDVKAVTTEFEKLKEIFPEFRLGLLHGKIKSQEKNKVIEDFREGKTQILVSTPVVEVGIDIPQANVMIIEGAHRFGLASLHQLRGRVGRAGQESFCLLFSPKQTETSIKRLKALERCHSGLELAEIDLKIRGPGELHGTKQHGTPDLKIASLSDLGLIRTARTAAKEIIIEINKYPKLKKLIETEEIAPN